MGDFACSMMGGCAPLIGGWIRACTLVGGWIRILIGGWTYTFRERVGPHPHWWWLAGGGAWVAHSLAGKLADGRMGEQLAWC